MYTMSEVEKVTGLAASTLRYYEKEGILPNITRDDNKRRLYTEQELKWIQLVIALRNIGMPMEILREYIRLLAQGDCTLCQRRELLLEHKKRIEEEMALTLDHLEKINTKIAIYDLMAFGKRTEDILI